MTRHVLLGVVVLVLGIIAGLFYFRDRNVSTVPQGSGVDSNGDQLADGTPTLDSVRDSSAGFGSLPDGSILGPEGEQLTAGQQSGGADSVGTQKGGSGTTSVQGTIVRYTDSGFTPPTVQVKSGSTVTFINDSARSMWVATGVHPSHQLLPGFDQKREVGASGVYEYTFTSIGTWQYHNHTYPDDIAVIVVTL